MLTITNDLIIDLKKMVYSIINNYSNNSNREDLFQAGMVGVIEASKKYDSRSNVKFSTFAYKYILGEVLKYLREDRNIKISRDIIREYHNINNIKDNYYKNYGRPISIRKISKILNIDENRVDEILKMNEKELSLYMEVDNDEINLQDIIYNKDEENNNSYIDLKNALNELDFDEKKLIYERYYNNKTQTDIAKESKISQVKVYRYERRILDKLKDRMM